MSLSVRARPARKGRAGNPYTARIYDQLEQMGFQVGEYGWGSAFAPPADIVHVHWPERSFNFHPLAMPVDAAGLLAGLRWQRRRGAKVVWTAHNLRAHERRFPRAEARFWPLFLDLVDGVIVLGEGSLARIRELRPQVHGKPTFVIPHPHYRGEYPDELDRSSARARLGLPENAAVVVAFGRVRTYKNLPGLIGACAQTPELHLVVAGAPHGEEIRRAVERAAERCPQVKLHLRFIDDADTQVFMRAADVVALQYHDPLNSGAALLALSFDRPVWVPPGSMADELDQRLPPGWVLRGELSGADALEAVAEARRLPERTKGEHLAAYDLAPLAKAHAEAYEQLASEPT